MKEFDIRTKIYFGPGALDRLKDLPYHRYLIVTDPFVVSSGLIRLITDPLDQHGAMYRLFDQVVPDPPIEKIVEGVQALTDFEPDSILCVGGGSAIDSAKAIREVAIQTNPSRVRLPLIAVPTTSGTGSEVTSFSVISDPANHTKYPLVADSLLPDEAILDVELVKSVPATVTANAGLIYGVGHAVYSLSDPRAVIFKSFVHQLAQEKGREDEYQLYSSVERLAPEIISGERKMYKGVSANVDFYSGFVYQMLGIPEELFTPLFAIARISGWSAHRLEELVNGNRIIRPAYKAILPRREYVGLSDR